METGLTGLGAGAGVHATFMETSRRYLLSSALSGMLAMTAVAVTGADMRADMRADMSAGVRGEESVAWPRLERGIDGTGHAALA